MPPLTCYLQCRDQGYAYDSSLSAAHWDQKPYPLEGSTCAFPDVCTNWTSVADVWCAPLPLSVLLWSGAHVSGG